MVKNKQKYTIIFVTEWFVKGIMYVKDVFINRSVMLSEHLTQEKYVKCNFLEYETIKIHEACT